MGRTLLIISAVFLMTSCDSSTGVITSDPVDQGWKAVDNYEYSFNTKDLALLEETLDPTFEFWLSEEEWDDYNGDGIVDTVLTKEMYLQFVSSLFNTYEMIELNLDGDNEDVWYGDTTGETLQLVRSFQKKAYNWVGGEPEGFTEQGIILFLSKPDTSGSWRITSVTEQTEL